MKSKRWVTGVLPDERRVLFMRFLIHLRTRLEASGVGPLRYVAKTCELQTDDGVRLQLADHFRAYAELPEDQRPEAFELLLRDVRQHVAERALRTE